MIPLLGNALFLLGVFFAAWWATITFSVERGLTGLTVRIRAALLTAGVTLLVVGYRLSIGG